MAKSPFARSTRRSTHRLRHLITTTPTPDERRHARVRKESPVTPASEVQSVAVLGLGRFGTSLALELMGLGIDVLGVDTDEGVVQDMSDLLTHTVQADVSREEVIEQLGLTEFDRVVVSIGSDLTANILTASILRRLGVKELWAMATSVPHAKILRQLGVEHVVNPQQDMGQRTAHLVSGSLQDWVDYGGGKFCMAKMRAPQFMIHQNVAETRLPDQFDVKVVARRSVGQPWEYITPETELAAGDVIIVAGSEDRLVEFGKKASNAPCPIVPFITEDEDDDE
ncbi:potassium channel family protein [Actinomyces vulturis]|uniref:potassium channel family protein n=1 Tax=Actinomyces vulturis TaxID=1857645 RepID=UPI000831DCE5|nr:TrkA family potassium uptake protein [Actinomyces vulturis]